jgi:ParB family chromosome partitioning protein
LTQETEEIIYLPLNELHPFPHHPFKVQDDEQMEKTAESIRQQGVLVPGIVRPRAEGGYEIVSGHRRKRACELAGIDTMPVIVRNLDDDAAILVMVDTNLQREHILPSERAFAYKMKLEALKRQGKSIDPTSSQVGMKLQTLDLIGENAGDSRNQVHRFIRLTYLIPPLLQMVDEKKIKFNPAVELSYLTHDEQEQIISSLEQAQTSPSLSQAQRLKKFSQEGKLTREAMDDIFAEVKKPPSDQSFLRNPKIRKYFPKSYSDEKVAEVILRLIESWHKQQLKKRQQQQGR